VRRGTAREDALRQLGCSTVTGDLKDPASLVSACRGADCVITTANSISSRLSGDSLQSVDRDGTLALVAAARANGVRTFVYTSVSPSLPADNSFVRYKREVEAAVKASGMRWVILQPSAFMEIHAGPATGWNFVDGRVRIMGSGRAPFSYVSVADVAAFAVASATGPAAANRSLHITGPEPLSAFDAVAVAERVTGKRFAVQRIPTTVLAGLSIATRPFNDALSSLFRMGIGLDRGDVVDMGPLQREFHVAQTTFEDYVKQVVSAPS